MKRRVTESGTTPLLLADNSPYAYGKTYDSIHDVDKKLAKVTFSYGVFLMELLFHTFDFLLLPLAYLYYGRFGIRTRLFVPSKGNIVLYLWLTMIHVFFITTNVIYFVFRPEDVSISEVLLLDFLVVLRAATIAAKYAYVPNEILKRWKKKPPSAQEFMGVLLLQGWSTWPPELINQERTFAEVRRDVDLANISLKMTDGTTYDVRDIIRCILRDSVALKYLPRTIIVQPITLVHVLIPSITRWISRGTFIGHDAPTIIIIVMIAAATYFYYPLNIRFSLVALDDLRRRKFAMHKLKNMLQEDCGYRPQSPEFDVRIKICVIDVNNILNWASMRKVLHDFGSLFYSRLQTFLGFFLILVIALVFLVVAQVFSSSSSFDFIAFAILSYDALVFSVVLYSVLVVGAKVNEQGEQHVSLIRELQLKALHNGCYSNQNYREITDTVDVACSSIESDSVLRPVRILGVKASGSGASILVTLALGLAGAVVQHMVRRF